MLAGIRDRLFKETFTCDVPVGKLSKEWAEMLGLSTNVVVGVGAIDAHMGALGAEIQPYYLSKVMGTSTCDMLIAPMDEVGDKLIAGLSLGTGAPCIFRALVEATAFGSKAIVDRFIQEGIPIKGVIALGGVAKKSSLVMQTVCDVLDMPIKVARSEQACALGSAMAAAVAAGVYPTIADAQRKMGGGFESEYHPIPENVNKYKELYQRYLLLGKFIEKDL